MNASNTNFCAVHTASTVVQRRLSICTDWSFFSDGGLAEQKLNRIRGCDTLASAKRHSMFCSVQRR